MNAVERLVRIPAGTVELEGMLELPDAMRGVVLFAHGSGSSRRSPRNNLVAAELRRHRLGTLLIDLLTAAEDRDYERRFDIALLTERLATAVRWLSAEPATAAQSVGLFGASTGAAAALQVAAKMTDAVGAVVSRGGRPDLAGEKALTAVRAPTLLIVGGHDFGVIELNEAAAALLTCDKEIAIVPGATHLFEEPGALGEVSNLAARWFERHLAGAR